MPARNRASVSNASVRNAAVSSGHRLGPAFDPSDGRRQVLVTGRTIVDWFVVDAVVGALPLVDALAESAVARGFDIVVTITSECVLQFPRPQMEESFNQVVRRKSQDPEAQGATTKPLGQGAGQPRPAADGATRQVEVRAERPALGNLELVTRLLKQSRWSAFVVFDQPENLWRTNPTEEQIRLVEVVSHWAGATGGAHQNLTVLVVKEERLEEFRVVSTRAYDASAFRREMTLSAPREDEIAAFLRRSSLRHGFVGSVDAVAKVLAPRQLLLRTVADDLARLSARSERRIDLADLCATTEDTKALASARAELDELVGLQEVKVEVQRIVGLARLAAAEIRDGKPGSAQSTHMLFLGRPGTGKTEVARIIGRLLHAAGVRRQPEFVEISLQDVSSGHNPGECVEKMQRLIDRAMGGVLFVDEAYLIAEDAWASQALQTLMKVMEDRREDLTVILAGYAERLSSLDRLNPGFLSRIPFQMHFPDYRPGELGEIFRRIAKKRGQSVDDAVVQRVVRIAEYRVQRGASGNGRWVRQLYESAERRRAERGGGALTAALVPDPLEFDDAAAQTAIDSLSRDLVGIDGIRASLQNLLLAQRDTRDHGLPPRATPRYLFLGGPGTGKTTVARRMAEILFRLGVTESPTLYEASYQDFTSVFTGGFAEATKRKFDQARGAVLFIDEAYRFADDEQGRRVLSQIVQHCTDPEYADVVVILAGYRREMEDLLAVNPGLRSRFPDRVEFADLPTEGLVDVALREIRRRGLEVRTTDAVDFQRGVSAAIAARRAATDFANARTAVSLCDEILAAQRRRRAAAPGAAPLELRKEDVPATAAVTSEGRAAVESLDETFVGLDSVKLEIRGLLNQAELRTRRRDAGMPESEPPNLNMVFMGGPGTGKTSVARWLAKALHEIGAVASDRCAECRAVELKGRFVGEAQENVRRLFRDNRGGVIVIDEAHAIRGGARQDEFARDILTTIVGCVTAPENRGTVVILAGYTLEMEELLASDPGLSGRFPRTVVFDRMSIESCIKVAFSMLRRAGYEWDASHEIRQHLQGVFEVRRARPGFANARDAVQVAHAIEAQLAERLADDPTVTPRRLEPSDFLGAM
jgi:SpoVK/Ycf46/Vps4 family AAA+-type ATPase